MSTITSQSIDTRKSSLRSIFLGGIFIFIAQLVIQSWIVATVLQQNPFLAVLQYMASGAVGVSAFEGGTGTALLGIFFHLIISFVISVIFVVSADRIPLVRRYMIPTALLYGFGVWIVMHLIVVPLSAAPPLPPPAVPYLIEEIIEHILFVGLLLGILVRRNGTINQ
ncbi:MAG: hypothetical protein GC179_08875 [Anaerolineaceae bacterium]|nr:hypothetical protein [Anaerolineaceae bacterium]